jgi:hypothetical protein
MRHDRWRPRRRPRRSDVESKHDCVPRWWALRPSIVFAVHRCAWHRHHVRMNVPEQVSSMRSMDGSTGTAFRDGSPPRSSATACCSLSSGPDCSDGAAAGHRGLVLLPADSSARPRVHLPRADRRPPVRARCTSRNCTLVASAETFGPAPCRSPLIVAPPRVGQQSGRTP